MAFLFFIILGIAICFGKLLDGDSSMGCLIPLLLLVIVCIFIVPLLNLLSNF